MTTWPTARAWLTALAVGAFQIVGTLGAADNQPERRAVDALAVVLLLAGPAALVVRERWPLVPVAASIAVVDLWFALGYPYGPIVLSVVVALFCAVQAGAGRGAWVLAALGYAGSAVAHTVDSRSEGTTWVALVVVAGWLVAILTASEIVRNRRQQAAERERAAEEERLRRLGEQRLALAQELHDVLAHSISLINVQSSVALHLLDEQPDRARPALAAIKDASHEALEELRGALALLRHGGDLDGAAPRTPAPRLADLAALVDTVRASGLDVRCDLDGCGGALPAAVEAAAYRIVQEALTNVTRHAAARRATVRVSCADGVDVEVVDDGVGGVAAAGHGITGMRERAEALGGSLEAGPLPGGGFRVAAHLPVRAGEP